MANPVVKLTETDKLMAARQASLEKTSLETPTIHPLTSVFKKLGYESESQHADYIKLMAITGCLPEETAKKFPQDRLMHDDEALQALKQMKFASERDAFDHLLNITQQKWTRSTYAKEGVSKSPDDNIARWFVQDSGLVEKYKEQLEKIVTRLGFFDGSTWTEPRNPDEVLLMGGLERHIVERLEGLKQLKELAESGKKVKLCYLSGPRGVFNFEPSLSSILAQEWFSDSSLKPAIQKVLDSNDDDWRSKRTMQLQLLILSEIGRLDGEKASRIVEDLDNQKDQSEARALLKDLWPQGKGFYSKSPEKYDDFTAGWPVAADIVAYHLKQLQDSMPGCYENLEIVPIIARGKNGRLANTADTIEQWLKERGSELLQVATAKGQRPVLASLSSQPHTWYMHETACKYLKPSVWRLVSVSVPSSNFQIKTVIDVATRLLYTLKDDMYKNLKTT